MKLFDTSINRLIDYRLPDFSPGTIYSFFHTFGQLKKIEWQKLNYKIGFSGIKRIEVSKLITTFFISFRCVCVCVVMAKRIERFLFRRKNRKNQSNQFKSNWIEKRKEGTRVRKQKTKKKKLLSKKLDLNPMRMIDIQVCVCVFRLNQFW